MKTLNLKDRETKTNVKFSDATINNKKYPLLSICCGREYLDFCLEKDHMVEARDWLDKKIKEMK